MLTRNPLLVRRAMNSVKSSIKRVATVRIDDVAAHANVSTATVSRTINNPESVRQSTRERIDRAIRELGYIPNAGARALMLGRSGTVGVIVPTDRKSVV